MSQTATELQLRPIDAAAREHIAVLSLNRPEAANAFNDAVMAEMLDHLNSVAARRDVRALVLRGKGRHFSAGADLTWMQASARLSYDANIEDARRLTALFERLATMPIPTVARVAGSAFGGAVGLTACCDIALAASDARFALSEVKLGLAPAVIMPYLARKMRPGALRRLALTGRVFGAAAALDAGLVDRVEAPDQLDAALSEELNALLAAAPSAQAATKELLARVQADGCRQGDHTAQTIATLRTGADGQAGLAAFFAKQTPPWHRNLPPDWGLDEGAP